MAQLTDLAEKYIKDVSSGKIIVGRKVRLAVERHLRDLKAAKAKGWYFDKVEAEIALTFISFLRHTKGEWAKKPFNLQPHQAFIIYSLFGWRVKKSGLRRYREAYIRMARKGGKSELAAAIAAYMLIADGEPGAEVYTAATTRDQARKVFDPMAAMCRMLKADDYDLRKTLKVFDSKNNCLIKLDDGEIPNICQPLSQDYDVAEGSNPSFASLDEFHLHKTTGMLDMLRTGVGARKQPLILNITTAGFDNTTPCYEYEKVAVKILTGEATVDHVLAIIFDLDEDDDWNDEKNWVKANPGLLYGTPSIEYLRNAYAQAKAEGISAERAFRVKNLNQWWNESLGWIPSDIWKQGADPFDPHELAGRQAFAGLDLAANRDLTALCILLAPQHAGEKYAVFWKYYCPQETLDDPSRNDGKIIYQKWAKEGFLTVTDGNVTDYDVIERDIMQINELFPVTCLGYDRHRSFAIMAHIAEHGIKIDPVPQTFFGESAPMMQIERLAYASLLQHGGNPVTDWMLSNVAIMMDANENIKLDRKKKKEKIDGMAAMVNAFHVYLKSIGEMEATNIYDLIGTKLIVK